MKSEKYILNLKMDFSCDELGFERIFSNILLVERVSIKIFICHIQLKIASGDKLQYECVFIMGIGSSMFANSRPQIFRLFKSSLLILHSLSDLCNILNFTVIV